MRTGDEIGTLIQDAGTPARSPDGADDHDHGGSGPASTPPGEDMS
jgi:hypothetical protein